jgi:hypothetical protein
MATDRLWNIEANMIFKAVYSGTKTAKFVLDWFAPKLLPKVWLKEKKKKEALLDISQNQYQTKWCNLHAIYKLEETHIIKGQNSCTLWL